MTLEKIVPSEPVDLALREAGAVGGFLENARAAGLDTGGQASSLACGAQAVGRPMRSPPPDTGCSMS
jgi:hypothetical protein